MCEMLWVCYNGEDGEDYCPHEMGEVGEIKEQDKGTEAINTPPPSGRKGMIRQENPDGQRK